jgi:Flp pilus assembly protein TadD
MAEGAEEARGRARVMYDAADYEGSLQFAREGLSSAPDDVELLVLAGRAGVELDAAEAVEHLRRATELAPSDANAWHHYGEALATEGRTAEADSAFRRAVELDPADQLALTHLGHTAVADGRSEEGVGYLAQAAAIAHAATSSAAISLVEMYRSFGQYEQALAQARRIAEAAPDDALARLDVAELSVAAGRLDEAREAFERLRELDDDPGHEGYPLRGLLKVEISAERWDRARELSQQAATIDPYGLSTDVAAFVREQTGEESGEETAEETDQPAPTRAEVEAALDISLADYRRMLVDNRPLDVGGIGG